MIAASTPGGRASATFAWLQLDADGEKKPADALVFSDEAGEPVGSFRTAWVTALLKGHDVTPVWKSYNWTGLTQDCHAEFRRIDLRWHDLRHEYASRLVEKNVPLAQVRDLLGHASITTRRSIRARENRAHRQSVKFSSRVIQIARTTSTPIACARRRLTPTMTII